ncbi:MAG: SPOR domain-containing protein [Pseudomonadota bacterium]
MSRFEDHPMSFEPSDDAYRGFDLSEDEETARGPLILTLALGVLIVFTAVVWNTYRQGIREPGEVPLIRAETTPYKTAGDDTGTAHINGLGETIYRQFEAGPDDEAPALRTGDDPYQVADTGIGTGTGEESLQGGPAIDLIESLGSSAGSEEAATPRQDQLRALAELATDALSDLNRGETSAAPSAAAATPPPATSATAPPPPAPEPAPTPESTPEPAAPTPATGLTPNGAYLVQLAAFRSAEAANTGWTAITAELPGLFTGTDKRVQRADLDAKGVFYRLQVGAFDTRTNATAFCAQLKAAGRDCIVVGG